MASHRTDSAKTKTTKSKSTKRKYPIINRPQPCDICIENGETVYPASITKTRDATTVRYCHTHYMESLCATSGCIAEPMSDSVHCRSCRK